MIVKKRNGKFVDFDLSKIRAAIAKAFKASGNEPECLELDAIVNNVYRHSKAVLDDTEIISVEEIQDIVEKELIKAVVNLNINSAIPKRYILYRDRRNKDRESINKLATTFHDVINIEDNNIKKSNANIDGNTPAGQMMIFGAESSKEHASNFIINPKFVKAHKDGFIHIHDADYYSTKACNCNQIDLVDLFSHDYIYTNDSVMRRPKRIASFSALAAIALQSEQNEMFGGQSIHSWDYAMAKGVALSFKENFKEIKSILDKANNPLLKTEVPDDQIKIGNNQLKESMPEAYRLAYDKTVKDTHEAMAAFIYNINSINMCGLYQ